MTVLVLSDLWLPFPGGAERLAFNVSRDLMRRGHDVRVVTGYPGREFDGPPIECHPIGIGPDHDTGWALIAAAVERHRPAVIVTHHLYAYEFEHELRALGIPVVQLVFHTRRLEWAACAVFISDYVRGQLDANPGDLTIVPPAMPDCVAETHGDAIGFVKPLPHKGAGLVADIARRLPHRRFIVLRGEWQTLESIELFDHCRNVERWEPVDDIRDFYRECRIVLVPSMSEDAGTVGQECAVNGIACVSSDAGGLPETNRGGVIVRSRSPHEWVRAIQRLDSGDVYESTVRRQMSEYIAHDHEALFVRLSDIITNLGA